MPTTSIYPEYHSRMSQTQTTMGKQGSERNCKESAAAAALVDVASGFAKKKASDSSSSPTNTNKTLPTNSASRKRWDSEQAAPMSDHGIAGRFPPLDTQHGFSFASNSAAISHPASLAAAAVAGGAHWPAEATATTTTIRSPVDPAGFHSKSVTNHMIATAAHQQQPKSHSYQQHQSATAVNMSMSSIGFGVDPSCSSPDGDATEAAYRAVRDAMERSAVCMPTAVPHRQNLSIHVKLGVPAKPSGEPMRVDVERLEPLLPRSVPLQPVEMTVGGLLIDHKEMEAARSSESVEHHPTVCTAVACVTLQQITTASEAEAAVAGNQSQGMAVGSPPVVSSPWAHLEQPGFKSSHSYPSPVAMPSQRRSMSTSSAPAAAAAVTSRDPLPSQVSVHRSNSMEVLAMISGEIRERHLNSQKGAAGGAAKAMAAGTMGPATMMLSMDQGNEASSQTSDNSNKNINNAYSYKKLAPGMTPKNNKRLFVKHSYRDYSREEPLPEEQYLVQSQDSNTRTPNAAFPLKLHETLSQIENDGYGHIIGWLPHGRSFKIFQQQDFVKTVLPKYFVMTKKSSFLRQLNLYGFNRISVGPDVGSYYHEKFLRGLKFLCRRMARQKVNGNGIRAAGNPDEEPHLTRFPSCPPSAHAGTASCNSSVTHNENDSHDNRPYSQIVHDSALSPGGKDSTMVTDENSHASHGSGNGAAADATGTSLGQPKRAQSNGGGGASGQVSFPLKLQRLLDKMESEGNTDIISWLPHGRAFLVHDVDKFVTDIMTQYFNQTKYSSFQRQLHMYNFQRITFGRDKGAYHHPNFQRGRPNLCLSMVRTRVNGKGCRRPGDPDAEPSFYEQEYLPPIPKGTVIDIPTDVSGVGSYDEEMDTKGQEGEEVGQTSEV